MINSRIADRYEVLETVSEGVLHTVFKARDRVQGGFVGVHAPHETLYSTDQGRALSQALDALKDIRHPRLCGVLDVVRENGPVYSVSTIHRGMDLRQRINKVAPFTLSLAVESALGISEALQALHGAGVCHGDLRPENILTAPDGTVSVMHYGLFPVVVATETARRRWYAAAAPYLAPEVTDSGTASPASDIYALGVILYEMLTGGQPYLGDSPAAITRKHAEATVPPSPRLVNPGVPRAVEGIVMKAMARDPQMRYSSAAEIIADLIEVRDALRFGRPLSWSPQERDAAKTVAPTGGKEPSRKRTVKEPDGGVTEYRPEGRDYLKLALKILATLIAMGILGFLGIVWWFTRQPAEVVVPEIRGMTESDAAQQLDKVGLRLVVQAKDYNDAYSPGAIYKSEPEANARVREGQDVRVWISQGSRNVKVPVLRGLSKSDAERLLMEAGLVPDVSNPSALNYQEAVVITQSPDRDEVVPRGSKVRVVLGQGRRMMPPPPEPEPVNPERDLEITYTVPGDGVDPVVARVDVDDAQGIRTVYEEQHLPGDKAIVRCTVIGKARLKFYVDDVLRKEETR